MCYFAVKFNYPVSNFISTGQYKKHLDIRHSCPGKDSINCLDNNILGAVRYM